MLLQTFRVLVKCSQTYQTLRCSTNINWQTNLVRQYGKEYRPRQHAAIVNEDELFEIADDDDLKEKLVRREHRQRLRMRKRKLKAEKKVAAEATVATIQADKKIFTKIHDNEQYLTPIILNAKAKSRKKKYPEIVLEGMRLMTDAIEAGVFPKMVIFSQKSLLDDLPSLENTNVKFYQVPYKAIQLWSNLTTSPGIMGIYPMPKIRKDPPEFAIPLTIIVDNVRDPGNMGSIIRTAAAVGCQKLLLTKGCVDIWDYKVLRSAAGAHFKLPIQSSLEWEQIMDEIDPNSEVFAADNSSAFAEELDNEDLEEETSDVDEEDKMKEKSKDEESEDDLEVVKKKVDKKKKERAEKMKLKKQHREELNELRNSIPSVPYYFVNYTTADAVLIVGGEAAGLSENSLLFMKDKSGARVHVPLYNEMESLNTSMAMGIVSYEINRQYTLKFTKEEDQKELESNDSAS